MRQVRIHRMMKIAVVVVMWGGLVVGSGVTRVGANEEPWWEFQCVDTMKYSRDLAWQTLDNPNKFKKLIEEQVDKIAATGATHVAIGTPYDEKFLPVLKMWVKAARKNDLRVWFRGNWSGWESWFGFEKISREEHTEKTRQFILENKDLFESGDVFTACPECENGGPGDPRTTGDYEGYRQFLITEHQMLKEAFRESGKNVRVNFFSMNGDMARRVMDEETTRLLGGVVTIDHYVSRPEQLVKDVEKIAEMSGGKVVLGELGAPIPDVHGELNQKEQAFWLETVMKLLVDTPELIGINYWTSVGGSTALWTDGSEEKEAVRVLTSFFQPEIVEGKVVNRWGKGVNEVEVTSAYKSAKTDKNGRFRIAVVERDEVLMVGSGRYKEVAVPVDKVRENGEISVELVKKNFWTLMNEWVRGWWWF